MKIVKETLLPIALRLSYYRPMNRILLGMQKNYLQALLSAFLLSILISGLTAPQLPSLGDASSRIVSPELEKRIGEDFLKQLHSSMKTSDDPLLKYYTESKIKELIQYSNFRDQILSIILVDNPNLNAFAAPGGVVGINLGLFLQARDIHEFSSVIAHELAHLSQRHFARGIEERKSKSLPSVASMIAGLLLGAVGGTDAALATISLAQAANQASQLRYSREREIEADRIGLQTMVNAELDPNGMSRMFERMQRAYRFTRRPPEFLLTHPLSETRIADAKNQARAYEKMEFADSVAFQMMKVKAQVSYQKNHAISTTKFLDLAQKNPKNLAYRYGLALSLSKQGLPEEALTEFNEIRKRLPNTILMLAAYAEMLIETGNHQIAQNILTKRLSISPNNVPLSMLYARSLTAMHKFNKAEEVLLKLSKVKPKDVSVWYELAETSGLAGNISGVHLARAEYFLMHGAYFRTIQHLEYAKSLIRRNNPQLKSKLSQRIQDLKTKVRMARS